MSKNNKKITALIGFGYWGKKLMRNIINSDEFILKYVVDQNEDLYKKQADVFPEVQFDDNLDSLLKNVEVTSVFIATPPETHFELAKKCIENKKHILIEKPFTNCFEKAIELYALAEINQVKIMVDYTFVFNGSIQTLKEKLQPEKFGQIHYLDSVRINLGIFQSNINVVWDLACHDLSIFTYLLNELPCSVKATGIDSLKNGIENIAYIYLQYKEKFAHINCSWSSPVKIRQMLIGGSKRAILYNDIEPTDKIKVYNNGILYESEEFRNMMLQDYRLGEVFIPKYDTTEPLKVMVNSFSKMIDDLEKPISSVEFALIILFILENIQKSIHLGGKEVKLDWKQVGPSLYSYITSKGMLNEH